MSFLASVLACCRWKTALSTGPSSQESTHGQPSFFHVSSPKHTAMPAFFSRSSEEKLPEISAKDPVYKAKCCLHLHFMLHDSISWQPGVNRASCYLGISGALLSFSCYMSTCVPWLCWWHPGDINWSSPQGLDASSVKLSHDQASLTWPDLSLLQLLYTN